jgi:phosphatidylglycerol:prolipoprotein diacylglycerol transferase
MLPILFTVPTPWGAQPVYAYGVMLGASLLVAFISIERIGSARDGVDRAILGNAFLVSAVVGMIGARLLYVLENREQFEDSGARWFDIASGGLAAYGGVAGALLGAAIYLRAKKSSLRVFGDAAAPAVGVGTVLTRIGCYLYGCDFGQPLSKNAPAWLQSLGRFPRWHVEQLSLYGSPAYLWHRRRFGLPQDSESSLPVHPTQLYEALGGLLLLALALYLGKRRRFEGQVILAVGLGYALMRFFVEYLRDDPERVQVLGFSTSQLYSLVLGAGCALAYSALRGKPATAKTP